MLGTHYNKHLGLALVFLFFMFCNINAQEKQRTSIDLASYLKLLETRYDIKFSYIDKDLDGLTIVVPENLNAIEEILQYIEGTFRIEAEKLNDRYYTLSKNSRVNICGIVLDNFADNTVTGATVEVLGTDVAKITDN